MKTETNLLQFTEDWFNLGILTQAGLSQLEAQYETTDDKSTEHYRWRAFCEFIKSNRPLDSPTAKALYELGNNDPDLAMGGAIMAEILSLNECPEEVIKAALNSDRGHLRKIAQRSRSQYIDLKNA